MIVAIQEKNAYVKTIAQQEIDIIPFRDSYGLM